jgi:hypothetical protein
VRIRSVRAVSIGERSNAESDEEMNETARFVIGDAAVRISSAAEVVVGSSGRPRIAASRLCKKVFNVGSNTE